MQYLEEVGFQFLKAIVRYVEVLQVLLELELVPVQSGQVVVVEAELLQLVEAVECGLGQCCTCK